MDKIGGAQSCDVWRYISAPLCCHSYLHLFSVTLRPAVSKVFISLLVSQSWPQLQSVIVCQAWSSSLQFLLELFSFATSLIFCFFNKLYVYLFNSSFLCLTASLSSSSSELWHRQIIHSALNMVHCLSVSSLLMLLRKCCFLFLPSPDREQQIQPE